MKIINDPVHGHTQLTDLQSELLTLPEVQRLRWVAQLGMTKMAFPGANGTRLEHSLGVSTVAGKIADHLQLDSSEKNLVQAAGLLHDLGHAPFSHTLETLFKFDHMKFTSDLITGKETMPFSGSGRIAEVLEKYELSPKDVASLVVKKYSKKKYLQQLIFGEMDADQMDYLLRDAYYTGATYGVIDLERTISTMAVEKDGIVFLEKGLSSIEDFLIARNHMYSSVYIHHTVEIADKMLLRAAQSVISEIPDFYAYTDWQMLAKLSSFGGYSKDMIDRITYRNLFKRAHIMSSIGLTEKDRSALLGLVEIGESGIEEKLSKLTGIKRGYVLADLNAEGLKTSEPRLRESNIKLLMRDGKIMPLSRASSLAKAILEKESTYSMFSVYSEERDVVVVEKAVKRMLK